MSGESATVNSSIFHGWFVVAGAFAVCFVGFGSAYTFSAFVEPLQKDFAASRGSVSLVFSLAGFLYFALGAISGPVADRWGARPLAVVGMILTGLGLGLAGAARSLDEVYAAYSLGIGFGIGLSYIPVLGVVQRWFIRRRGLASGFAVGGIGVGTLVMPPLASALIATIGWRPAYVVLGVFAAVAGAGMALFIEDSPDRRGLQPDGDLLPPGGSAAVATGASVSAAVGSTRFISLYFACLLNSFGLFVPVVHLLPYAVDHGVPQSLAILLVGAIGVGSTAGRFFLGGLADRFGRHRALLVMFIGMALALAIWLFATVFWSLAVFAFIYGVVNGGYVALLPAVVADYFGRRNVGAIIGVLATSVAIGTLIGPSAAGFAFDATHSYALAIIACIIANLIAAGLVAISASAPTPAQD